AGLRLEAVERRASGQLGDPGGDRVDAAARHRVDEVLAGLGLDDEARAPALGPRPHPHLAVGAGRRRLGMIEFWLGRSLIGRLDDLRGVVLSGGLLDLARFDLRFGLLLPAEQGHGRYLLGRCQVYRPALKSHPMTTARGPVTIRLNSTAGTPTSTVSGSASPSARPTGMKSHPTCRLMAHRAGSAIVGEMLPMPIWVPRSTPITWAITAPGPSSGDSTGKPMITDRTKSPTMLLASGESTFANQSPIPVSMITPIRKAMNAMNGRMFLITWSIVSRPA